MGDLTRSPSSEPTCNKLRDYDCVCITRALKDLFRHNILDRLIISDMVALPVIDQRTSTSDHPSTATKLMPRKGVTESWFEQMNDLLSQRKLTQVTKEDRPTPVAELQNLLPGVDNDIILAIHEAIAALWWAEATQLYYIVRASTDFSGIYESKDLATIKDRFWVGDYRHGPQFLHWVTSFTDPNSVASQAKIIKEISNCKLNANCTQDQFGQHCSNLLLKWKSVSSNDVKRPAGFYHTLHESLPDGNSGNLWHLKCWLSDRMADDDPMLTDPNTFVDRLIKRAEMLGMPSGGGGSIHAITGLGKNNCRFCPSAICINGSQQNKCLAMNSKLGRPSGVKDGQWNYILLCRSYIAAVPGIKSLKGVTLAKMRETVDPKGNGGTGGAHVVTGTPAPSASASDESIKGQGGKGASIVSTIQKEVPDPEQLESFLQTLPLFSTGPAVQVVTRSQIQYEYPCAACNHSHAFDYVCGPMLGLSYNMPGPSPSCGRSQCEFYCWCDRRNWVQSYTARRAEFLDRRNDRLTRELGLPADRLAGPDPAPFNHQVVPQLINHPIVGPMWRAVQCVTKFGIQVPSGDQLALLFDSHSSQNAAYSSGGADQVHDDSRMQVEGREALCHPLFDHAVMCMARAEPTAIAAAAANDDVEDGEDATGHERTFEDAPTVNDRVAAIESAQARLVSRVNDFSASLNRERDVVAPVGGSGNGMFSVSNLDFSAIINGMNILEAARKNRLVEWLNALFHKQTQPGHAANPVVSADHRRGKLTAAPADASPTEHAALGLAKQIQADRILSTKLKVLKHPLNKVILFITQFLLKRSWPELILGSILLTYTLPAHLVKLRRATLQLIIKVITRWTPRLPSLILMLLAKLGSSIAMAGTHLATSSARAISSSVVREMSGNTDVVAPIGRISAQDKILAATTLMPSGAILGDNGATIDCSTTGIGRLPGTFNASEAGSLSVGDASASLRSDGTWLHAVKLMGANGQTEERILRMHDTPGGIADIISEVLEHNDRSSSVIWNSGEPRRYHTSGGAVLELAMAPNGLGWLRVEPINNRTTIKSLLDDYYRKVGTQSSIDLEHENQDPQCESDNESLPSPWITLHSVLDPNRKTMAGCPLLRANLTICANPVVAVNASTSLTSTGFGRAPKLTGLEILTRTHVFLGHASIDNVLRTLQGSTGLRAGVVTKADIEEFVRRGCGICETAKMRRRAFKAPTDKTPPPIGKRWVFDSLTLRTVSALGNKYLTRFVNVVEGGDGKRRTYGHKVLTEEALEGCIQKLRAFVRPHHGEIFILKHDGLPALRSHAFADYMADSKMHDEMSPPFVHEGVGGAEITFQWDVPSANALLAGSDSGEEHFETAFYDVERATNRIIRECNTSRDMVFYGRAAPDVLTCHLCYGSPVKFLIHPEIRDSKFDDHAQSGRLRGPSREDESDTRCWVETNAGAMRRHVTVDIGCMRVDERAVLARCDRDHPSHQPMAIDAADASPEPNFSKWHNPALESPHLLDIWTSSTPLPSVPTLVILGSGPEPREGNIAYWVRQLSTIHINVITIDRDVGGYEHDWTIPTVNEGLRQAN